VTTYTVEEMKIKIQDPKEQYQVLLWTENALRPLADPAEYERLCKMEEFQLTPEIFKAIFVAMNPFAAGGSPGHDQGHHMRDILGVAAIIGNDQEIAKAYHNDVIAGLIAGAFHDAGCSFMPRYKDGDGWIGHDLGGAKILYDMLEGLVPEHIRLLASYAVACHTHALNPMTTKIGYIRQPWEDRLFYNLGRPIRVAVWLTRFADRLDTNGVTLMARHIVAQLDSYVYKGVDLSGTTTYVADDLMLKLLLKPQPIMEEKTPSTLKHIANFAASNDQAKIGAYNQHDARFPTMNRLITEKAKQAVKLGEVIGNNEKTILDTLLPKSNASVIDSQFFWDFLKKVAVTEDVEAVHSSFIAVWDNLTPDEQNQWIAGIKFANKEYDSWVGLLKFKVKNATNPMIDSLIPTIMEIVNL